MQEVENESEFYRNKATRQGNAVVIVTRLRAVQPRNCGSILGRGKRFFFSRKRPDRLWAYPAFYSTEPLFPGIQRRDREAHPSPPSSDHCLDLYLPFPHACMAYTWCVSVPLYTDIPEKNIRCGSDSRDAIKKDGKIMESASTLVLKSLFEMLYAVFIFRERIHYETIRNTDKPSNL